MRDLIVLLTFAFSKKRNSKFLSLFPYLARLVDRSLGISLERVALSENPQTDWFAGNVEKPSLRERRSNANTLGSIEEEREKEERERERERENEKEKKKVEHVTETIPDEESQRRSRICKGLPKGSKQGVQI